MAMRFINAVSLSDFLDSTRRLQQPRFLSRHLSQFIQTSITPETLSVGRKKTEPWNGIEYIRREQNTKQCWSVSSVYFGHIATYKAKEKQRMHGTLINCTHSPPSNFQFSSFVAFVFQCAPSIHISLSLSIFLSHLKSHGKLILGSIYFIFFPSLQLCSVRPFLKFNIRAGSGIRCVCVCVSVRDLHHFDRDSTRHNATKQWTRNEAAHTLHSQWMRAFTPTEKKIETGEMHSNSTEILSDLTVFERCTFGEFFLVLLLNNHRNPSPDLTICCATVLIKRLSASLIDKFRQVSA